MTSYKLNMMNNDNCGQRLVLADILWYWIEQSFKNHVMKLSRP